MFKTFLFACTMWLLAPAVEAAGGSTLFRLFLLDGSAIVSFGEFARLNDQVILSVPIGGTPDQPRLYVVTLPASQVDWVRTELYSSAVRSQWYAETRGEQEFQQLSSEVARVLNEIALIPDRRRGLEMAENARRILAEWPRTHFGYRQGDVREIVSLLDESIADLRASLGVSSLDLALVAAIPDDASPAPLLEPPAPAEQIAQVFRVASLAQRSADRVALLQAALTLLRESASSLTEVDLRRWREDAEKQLRKEASLDADYASLSRRVMSTATKAAAAADVSAVERILEELRRRDEQLGQNRPEAVDAVRASIQAQLVAARNLRLRRDRYVMRRGLYRDYQRSVGSQLRVMATSQSSLEAIRRLAGPSPRALAALRKRLDGGADRLQRIGQGVPDDLRDAHGLLVSAWRFAEKAVTARSDAISSGNLATAWEASSAAAGAMLMFSRAERDIRAFVEPPRLLQ